MLGGVEEDLGDRDVVVTPAGTWYFIEFWLPLMG
jgi:hypothetical protein